MALALQAAIQVGSAPRRAPHLPPPRATAHLAAPPPIDDDDDAWLRDELHDWQPTHAPQPAQPTAPRRGRVPATAAALPPRTYAALLSDDDEEEEEDEEEEQQPAAKQQKTGAARAATARPPPPARANAARVKPRGRGGGAPAPAPAPLPAWATAATGQQGQRRAGAGTLVVVPLTQGGPEAAARLQAALEANKAYGAALEACLDAVRSRRATNAALRWSLGAPPGGSQALTASRKRRRRAAAAASGGGALAEPLKALLCCFGRGPAAHGGTSRFFRAPEGCAVGPAATCDASAPRWLAAKLRLPHSIQQRPWSDADRAALKDGVEWHLHQAAVDAKLKAATAEGRRITLEEVRRATAALPTSAAAAAAPGAPPVRVDVSAVDWASVRALRLPGRSAAECKSRWLWFECPTVNTADGVWTASEDADLAQLAEAHGGYAWEEVSDVLRVLNEKSCEPERVARPVRSPAACLRRYQTRVQAAQRFGQRPWTGAEDAELSRLLALHGPGNWSLIGQAMKRTGHQVQHRAKRILVPGKKKGKWDAAEDAALRAAVTAFGVGAWARVAGGVPGRTDVQCRERYVNCLAPGLDKSAWKQGEDEALLAAVERLRAGGKVPWCDVAKVCAPRTDYQCACRWEALQKQLKRSASAKASGGGGAKGKAKAAKKKKAALLEDEDSGGSGGVGGGCEKGGGGGARGPGRQHLARAKARL